LRATETGIEDETRYKRKGRSNAARTRRRPMRIRRRSAVIALLAATLGVAVYAIAANATLPITCPSAGGVDNKSCVTFKFLPNTGLSTTTRKAGSIEVRTHTNYAHPADKTRGGYASTVTVLFDSDFAVTPGTLPKCTGSQVTGKTPHDAMIACGPTGTNNAWLLPSTSTVFNGTANATGGLKGCTLAFNGKPNATGNPTIVLYARIWLTNFTGCGNPRNTTDPGTTVVLTGTLTNGSAPYGKKLTVPNIDNLPLSLNDFDAKVTRGGYVSGKCSGHNGTNSGGKYWKMKTTFVYSGGSTNGQPADTANATQNCSN
jgi:hypothetical protein